MRPHHEDTIAQRSSLLVRLASCRVVALDPIVDLRRRSRETDHAGIAMQLVRCSHAADALEIEHAIRQIGGIVERTAIEHDGLLAVAYRLVDRRLLECVLHAQDRLLESGQSDRIVSGRDDADLRNQDRGRLRHELDRMAELVLERLHRRGLAGARTAGQNDFGDGGGEIVMDRLDRLLVAENGGQFGQHQVVDAVRDFDRAVHPLGERNILVLALVLALDDLQALERAVEGVDLEAPAHVARFLEAILAGVRVKLARRIERDFDFRLRTRQSLASLVRDLRGLAVDDTHAQALARLGVEIALLESAGRGHVRGGQVEGRMEPAPLDFGLHVISLGKIRNQLGSRSRARQNRNMNKSPWLDQLKRTRKEDSLSKDAEADIAIVGGGIAGVSTAYFLLKHTTKSVVLVEANLVAHGATGHNAGQIVSYFERPFADLVKEFGLDLAAHAQDAIDTTWIELESMMKEANIQTPLNRCTGYVGFSTREQMTRYLEDAYWRSKAGIPIEKNVFLASERETWLEGLPSDHVGLVSLISHREIQALLETNDPQYIAAGSSPKGCMNSASFTEEVVGFLLAQYPERFRIFERSPVNMLELKKKDAVLHINGNEIRASRVVLCTNGFRQITILNREGEDIDVSFHEHVHGTIGYMQAYLDPLDRTSTAISYFPSDAKPSEEGDVYYYLTRRPHEQEKHIRHNLVCIGGPEERLADAARYDRSKAFPESVKKEVGEFVAKTYEHISEKPEPEYVWHGLMGYTSNGVRLIGAEPCNPVLLYNLGCNGIGILPSIYGGKRIAQIIGGKKVKPSIFDPKDQRCEVKMKKPLD